MPATRPWTTTAIALLGLAVLQWLQVHWVAERNFGGFDEWVVLDLNARGIIAVPYANRPLGLVVSLPAAWLSARWGGLRAFTLFYSVYLVLAAVLLLQLFERLAPSRSDLALLVAAFFLVWAPGDLARLSTIERVLYGGITCAAVLCAAAFVESWYQRSLRLLALACLGAFLLGRCYEGALAVLAGAPLLLLGEPGSRRMLAWAGAWELAIAASLAMFLRFMFSASADPVYQLSVLRPERDPRAWLARMGWQYIYHFAPLVTSAPAELMAPAVAAAVAVFLLCFGLWGGSREEPQNRRSLLGALLLGGVLAGLGYSLVVLGTRAPTAFRLQFLSGPGAALALAAGIGLAASFAPARMRRAVTALLAAWVIAVGTGRTVAMQRIWDGGSSYPAQTRMLAGLLQAVPAVREHTLLVSLDEGGAWHSSAAFHHAVNSLYAGKAAGFVPGVTDAPYPLRFAPDGAHVEPWPVVRAPWNCTPTLYGYDEIVAVRYEKSGAVTLLDDWPSALPPLPSGASYAPRSRIVAR